MALGGLRPACPDSDGCFGRKGSGASGQYGCWAAATGFLAVALGGLRPACPDPNGCFGRKGSCAGGYLLQSSRGTQGFTALVSRPTAGSP